MNRSRQWGKGSRVELSYSIVFIEILWRDQSINEFLLFERGGN